MEQCWTSGAEVGAKVFYAKEMGRHWKFLSKGEETCFGGLGSKPRALHVRGKHTAPESHPGPVSSDVDASL